MRILLTNHFLVHRTGSEMFTSELALGLRRRGHAVTVFTATFSDMADVLRQASIACITDVADMAARPDVIIGSSHHETVRALLHFHDVPVLTICHDRSAAQGRPAQFAQVVRHIAVDENCAERLVHEFGIAREAVELIQNGVDLTRFVPRAPLPATPRKALLFSNYASYDAQLEEIRAACTTCGLSLDVMGLGTGTQVADPTAVLGRYDIVFGKGRCATEALVTGNAVLMLDPSAGLGEMVTAATTAQARRWNFGRALMTRPITRQHIVEELRKYDADDAREVSRWMRAHAGLDTMLAALERSARRAIAAQAVIVVPPEQRAREAARYLDDWIRRGSPTAAHLGLAALQQQMAVMQQAHAAHAAQLQAQIEAALSAQAVEAAAQHLRAAAWQERARQLEASRSWRLMAPLRWAGRLLRSLRSRA